MAGIFDDLFDLNDDGKVDAFEKATAYASYKYVTEGDKSDDTDSDNEDESDDDD